VSCENDLIESCGKTSVGLQYLASSLEDVKNLRIKYYSENNFGQCDCVILIGFPENDHRQHILTKFDRANECWFDSIKLDVEGAIIVSIFLRSTIFQCAHFFDLFYRNFLSEHIFFNRRILQSGPVNCLWPSLENRIKKFQDLSQERLELSNRIAFVRAKLADPLLNHSDREDFFSEKIYLTDNLHNLSEFISRMASIILTTQTRLMNISQPKENHMETTV